MDREAVALTVQCIAYNQKKYIRRCLEGLVSQITAFRFLILVYDDASQDGTREIIREYEERYPGLVQGIYPEQNQYSRRGFQGVKEILDRHTLGRYQAYCEGDDFWTDPYKLQKQYDAAEAAGAALCLHSVRCVREDGEPEGGAIPGFSEGFVKSSDEFLRHLLAQESPSCYVYHLNSYLVRCDALEHPAPRFAAGCGVMDVPLLLEAASKGPVVYLPEEMSCYRTRSEEGWTVRTERDRERLLAHEESMCGCLEAYKEYTGHRYDSLLDQKILRLRFKMLLFQEDFRQLSREPYRSLFLRISRKRRMRIRLSSFCPPLVRGYDWLKGRIR